MNERFKELAGNAGFIEDDDGNDFHVFDGYESITCTEELKKFAELIARECAELSVNSQYTNTKSEYYEGFNEALIYAGNKIRKHFGVEE